MENNRIREVCFYKHYFHEFYNKLRSEVKKKFNWTFKLLATLDSIPEKHFKHLKGSAGLYEIRVEYGTDIYRAFCFFDKGKLIIVINGFQKKTQKTPRSEITMAEKLKKQYENEKRK